MKVKRDFQPVEIRLETEGEYRALMEIFDAAASYADGPFVRSADLIFKIRQFKEALK